MNSSPNTSPVRPVSQDLLRDVQEVYRVCRRGWRYIAISVGICLTIAAIYLAKTRREYQSTARLLVVQQGSRPLNVGNNETGGSVLADEDLVPNHSAIIASPLVVGQTIKKVGIKNLPSLGDAEDPVQEAIKHLKVTRPDRLAKIIQIDYRAWSPQEATRMVEALVDGYKSFLDNTYQKNSGEVVSLITKARDELSKDLARMEQEYVDFRQSRPITATDGSGRSLIARRLDEWDEASNEVLVRAVQVKAQLELGRKLSEAKLSGAAILQALNQLGAGSSDLRTLAAGGPFDLNSGYLGQLVQEQQQLSEKFGPDYAKVKALQEQILRVQERTREARGRFEDAEVRDLMAALDEGARSIEKMRAEYASRFDRDREEAKKVELDMLTESNLKDGMERSRMLFNTVVEQLKQAQFVSDFNTVSSHPIEAPSSPLKPVRPRFTLTLAMALVAGCMLGLGAALVADRLDPRIRSVEVLRKILEYPVLGQVQLVPKELTDRLGEFGLVANVMPRSTWAEAYRAVRTNIEFLRRSRRVQVILVASPHSGDGKSVTASNLAISLVQAGRRVLLVDADLRKPSQHRFHGLSNDIGLTSIQGKLLSMDRLVQPSPVPNLDVVAAGPDISNPAELLSSPWMHAFVEEARESYDIVIIDSSPLLAVTDGSILVTLADGVILVVRPETLKHHEAEATREMLVALGNPVLGTIINGANLEQGSYGYGYGYGAANSPYAARNNLPEPGPSLPPQNFLTNGHIHHPDASEFLS